MKVSTAHSQPEFGAAAFLYFSLGRPFEYQVLIVTHEAPSLNADPFSFGVDRPHFGLKRLPALD